MESGSSSRQTVTLGSLEKRTYSLPTGRNETMRPAARVADAASSQLMKTSKSVAIPAPTGQDAHAFLKT